jgi:hypothetical protein
VLSAMSVVSTKTNITQNALAKAAAD